MQDDQGNLSKRSCDEDQGLSLTNDYKQFVVNFNINNMEKTILELHSMLKTVELSMGNNKPQDVLAIDGGAKKKWSSKNDKGKANQNPKGNGKGKAKWARQQRQALPELKIVASNVMK